MNNEEKRKERRKVQERMTNLSDPRTPMALPDTSELLRLYHSYLLCVVFPVRETMGNLMMSNICMMDVW